METIYFSFHGNRLKLYKLRGDYFALAQDISKFFNIDKKYFLFIASKNKNEYTKKDRIVLNKAEFISIFVNIPIKRPTEIYAFGISAVMALSFRINKGDIAPKMSKEVVKGTSQMFKDMRKTLQVSNELKELKQKCTKAIVELEIARSNIPKDNNDIYEKMNNDINEAFDRVHQLDNLIDKNASKIKKLLEDLPENMRNVFFNPDWEK